MKRLFGLLSFLSAIFWLVKGLLLIVNTPFFITGLIMLTLSISYLATLKITKFWTPEIVGMRNIYLLGTLTLTNSFYYIYYMVDMISYSNLYDNKNRVLIISMILSIIIPAIYFHLNYKKVKRGYYE